jgi:hypothetical protein
LLDPRRGEISSVEAMVPGPTELCDRIAKRGTVFPLQTRMQLIPRKPIEFEIRPIGLDDYRPPATIDKQFFCHGSTEGYVNSGKSDVQVINS